MTMHGNGTVKTIVMIKHLKGEVKRPKMFSCYNYHNGIIYEEENIIFVIEPKLFSIGTISLLENF